MIYPENIMCMVRQYMGLEPDDEKYDDEILSMKPSEVFGMVCEWEGLIGYGKVIREWIKDIYGINLDEM